MTIEASNYFCSSPLVLLSFLIFLLYIIRNKRYTGSASLASAIKNNHRFLDWATELVVASPIGTIAMFDATILTANPANIEHIVKTNFHNYPKGSHSNAIMEDLLGHGIFNSDGEQWHLQRKIAAVEFNSKTFRNFAMDTVSSQVVDRLLPFLSSSVADDESSTIDLQDTLDRFAFDNVCKIAFDFDPCRLAHEGTSEGDAFASSYEQAATNIMNRFRRPHLFWNLTRLLNVGAEKRVKRHIAILNDFAAKIVIERKNRRDKTGNDLLTRFVKAGNFPNQFLQDMVLNYVLAGRDTTSSAMAWFFWLVSSKSAIEQNILNEIREIRDKHGSRDSEAFTIDELREMNYLHAAISESMRLYPPVTLESRTCKEADILPDGTKVAKGSQVLHSPYIMGRMESIWGEDCREFKPDRWLENDIFQPRNPYQYPVFHAGPRMCLGKEMAYIQMKSVVASIMEKFVIDVIEEGEREQDITIVLRMKKGLPVRIKAR